MKIDIFRDNTSTNGHSGWYDLYEHETGDYITSRNSYTEALDLAILLSQKGRKTLIETVGNEEETKQ